jgi:hypothetical protein
MKAHSWHGASTGLEMAARQRRAHPVRVAPRGADKLPVNMYEMERRMLGQTLASGCFNDPLMQPFRLELVSATTKSVSRRAS